MCVCASPRIRGEFIADSGSIINQISRAADNIDSCVEDVHAASWESDDRAGIPGIVSDTRLLYRTVWVYNTLYVCNRSGRWVVLICESLEVRRDGARVMRADYILHRATVQGLDELAIDSVIEYIGRCWWYYILIIYGWDTGL